ncbi:MAG: recombinase family protein [Planctomycetes bacterium]|nr:recombinase family protein [Planctomycetota bacterium]
MSTKKVVLYCRFSTDMQRADSCADQEREIRAGLVRLGIDPTNAIVIRDEGESGTKTARDGFQQLSGMVARGEVGVLAVDDQARLTRAENAFAFITDLVFAGGRFVSTGENIDTSVPGWELRVQVMELHNGLEIRGLRHKVRRGQEGRVRDDGSAGDHPFGYDSHYIDPDWAAQLARRGPKPKKALRICQEEANWVRQVFAWFIAGLSIGWIARELTKLKVDKGRRASQPGWHHEQVRRMVANAKYIGQWVWGKTTTQRNSRGQKKQIDVPQGEQVCRYRPDLRIIEQEIWDQAKARLAVLEEAFGHKEGQKPRGPKPNPAEVYPRSPLGGLLTCGRCGAVMWQQKRKEHRYYVCSGVKSSRCNMTTQVPAERAEQGLTDFLLEKLKTWPEWMNHLYQETSAAIHAAAARVPEDRERDVRRAGELDRQINNLVTALAEGGLTSSAVANRLCVAEREKAEIDVRLAAYAKVTPDAVALPDESWVAEQLSTWATNLATGVGGGSLLQTAIRGVVADPVIAPGKTRGFIRLKFQVNAWDTLIAAIGDHLPVRGLVGAPDQPHPNDPEFTLDLGEPTAMERWAPQIATWRTEGVTWEEIVSRTGMDLSRVFVAWKRYTGATDSPPPI